MVEPPEVPDDAWPSDDLEQAYRQALETNEAIEWEFQQDSESNPSDDSPGDGAIPNDESVSAIDSSPTEARERNADDAHQAVAESTQQSEATVGQANRDDGCEDLLGPRITPRQIVEAALFVGGAPLTTRKLLYALRGDFDHSFVEDLIDDLNRQYAEEGRPYEIRLGEGGYRLTLRYEFERVRNRVYGFGPKEVKLSQEALEVLALVAYRQPITKQQVEDFGKKNAGGVLRQLLRRELISIERGQGNRKDVKYHTTARFLSVFGLRNLEELPQAEDLDFK